MRKRKIKRRKLHSQKTFLLFSSIILSLFIVVGFASFQTTIKLNVKGNVKDLKQEVDSKVPTNDLLFWGQADNKENTLTILKDKSGNNNDVILNNFDNTSTSGFYNKNLVFDGINDYGVINMVNYDNSKYLTIDFVIKVENINNLPVIIESSNDFNRNSGVFLVAIDPTSAIENHDCIGFGTHWSDYYTRNVKDVLLPADFRHYTLILDTTQEYGKFIRIYEGGFSISNMFRNKNNVTGGLDISDMTLNNNALYLGSRGGNLLFAKMSLKEVMIYKRVLTDSEIEKLHNGYKRKYKIE